MTTKVKAFPRMCRLYEMLLLLYPRSHRRDYGELMVQLFRDQCRDASRESGASGLFAVWQRLLIDLMLTAPLEHLSNLTNTMKTLSINQLNHLLFAVAVGFALLTSPTATGPLLATVFVYLSTLALLARAVAEWFRPPGESLKAIAWGFAVLIAYGFIMPFWAKLQGMYGSAFPVIPALHAGAIFLNLIVPLLKALLVRTWKTA